MKRKVQIYLSDNQNLDWLKTVINSFIKEEVSELIDIKITSNDWDNIYTIIYIPYE